MIFEWDEAKSLKLKLARQISFEEIEEAIVAGKLLGVERHPTRLDQSLLIVRMNDQVWAIVAEKRGVNTRFVTAYPSRKWRKKYGL